MAYYKKRHFSYPVQPQRTQAGKLMAIADDDGIINRCI